MRRFALIAAAAVLVVALPACGNDDDDDATTPTTNDDAPAVAPLTGLPDPDGAAETRSALWVKIGNNPEARPQTGLGAADVVYEEVAEGGITRFAAVYNSTVPDRAGPVRSVRPMDVDLVQALRGIFAYSGGAPDPTRMIEEVPGLLTVDESSAGDAMGRSTDRTAPDNLYLFGELAFPLGGDPKPPPPLFEFLDEGDAFGGEAVEAFQVGFEVDPVTYRWDAGAGAWLRFLGDEPFSDIDGDQITATNVIVQFTDYPNDAEGITIGEGEAWVFSNGEVVRGSWSRADASEPTRYLDAEGNEVELTPGRTWIALVPNGLPVDVTSPPTTEEPAPAP